MDNEISRHSTPCNTPYCVVHMVKNRALGRSKTRQQEAGRRQNKVGSKKAIRVDIDRNPYASAPRCRAEPLADKSLQRRLAAGLQQKPEAPFKMAPFALASQTYGFVVPMNSVLRTPIDVELLQMQRSGEVKSITDRLLQ